MVNPTIVDALGVAAGIAFFGGGPVLGGRLIANRLAGPSKDYEVPESILRGRFRRNYEINSLRERFYSLHISEDEKIGVVSALRAGRSYPALENGYQPGDSFVLRETQDMLTFYLGRQRAKLFKLATPLQVKRFVEALDGYEPRVNADSEK